MFPYEETEDQLRCIKEVKEDMEKELDRLELETNKFHETVYEGYLSLAKKYPDRVVVIDGEASKEEVLQATIEVIDKYLNK